MEWETGWSTAFSPPLAHKTFAPCWLKVKQGWWGSLPDHSVPHISPAAQTLHDQTVPCSWAAAGEWRSRPSASSLPIMNAYLLLHICPTALVHIQLPSDLNSLPLGISSIDSEPKPLWVDAAKIRGKTTCNRCKRKFASDDHDQSLEIFKWRLRTFIKLYYVSNTS